MATCAFLNRIRFEVFGKVQGVWFRKYTQKAALKLNLVGWVENTDVNTVIGEAQGSEEEMEEFKNWLFEGSPKSRVERVEFLEEGVVENPEYETFEIRR